MIKTYKKTLILTSIITLLPMIAGFLLWAQLPKELATHFGPGNVPNGWSSKLFTIVGLPLFLLAIHWICVFATANDPKHERINGKLFHIVFWICPIVSLLCAAAIYSYALGMPVNQELLAKVLGAVMFLVVGNYLPKCRQNYTVGIKIPWTLADEDNWNRTHRMAGKLWVAAGILFLLTIFMKNDYLILAIILFAAFVPMAYSFAIYKEWIK